MASPSYLKKISKAVSKNFSEQVSFVAALVREKSENPYTPELSSSKIPIELGVSDLIVERLRAIGLSPRRLGVSKKRPNVVCYWGPQRFRKSLILNGNMDTTPVSKEYTLEPFSGAVRDRKLYGVGAADMKGALSAYIYAVKALLDVGIELDGRLILEFVVDEEPGGCSEFGTAYLLKRGIRARAAIIGKPGTKKISIGNRGGYRFKLTTYGEGVHTGRGAWERKEAGRNAIMDMARAIVALESMEIPFKPARAFQGRSPVFTFPTKIEGGISINIVPEKCEAYGDVRLMPGNSDKQVKIWIREKLSTIPGLRYDLEDLLFVPSFDIDKKEEIVELLSKYSKDVLRTAPKIEGSGPWGDAWMLVTHDIPTVSGFGPDGEGYHGADEWVDLNSLKRVTEIYAKVIVDFLGVKKIT
jgi:acetylornithine deacetylase/succinyl-diaminopimelate desuccinylase-like protein